MHGTREQVLEYVIHHREARVEDLANALEISTVAARRHLENLRADGLVDVRAVKQAKGRPFYAYHATELATETLPSAYADLLERMLRSLGEREDVISVVMSSVAESLAAKHRADVALATDSTEVRVERVTETLRADGILDHWHSDEDGYHLVNGACPYRKAAEISTLPCESDRKAIELLLGVDVEQLNRIVDGSPVCEYLVRSVRRTHENEIELIDVSKGVS